MSILGDMASCDIKPPFASINPRSELDVVLGRVITGRLTVWIVRLAVVAIRVLLIRLIPALVNVAIRVLLIRLIPALVVVDVVAKLRGWGALVVPGITKLLE